MMLSSGDKSVVSNLRLQYGDALLPYADETIAKAWREYSLSDEYTLRDEQPELFLEWTEMVHAEA